MEQLELLAGDLDNAREVLRCVIGCIRSAGGTALWEGRSTQGMYVQTISGTRAGRWFRLREAALRLMILYRRPRAPGIISKGGEPTTDHVVVIVRLTHVHFRNPLKTLVDVVLSLGYKNVTAIAELRIVG